VSGGNANKGSVSSCAAQLPANTGTPRTRTDTEGRDTLINSTCLITGRASDPQFIPVV